MPIINAPPPATPFADTTLAAPASSFDFSPIPSGVALRIYLYARGTAAASGNEARLTFNGDNAGGNAHYNRTSITADGTSVTTFAQEGADYIAGPYFPAANGAANQFGALEYVIPNYAGTVGYKSGLARQSSLFVTHVELVSLSFVWSQTAAITRVTIVPDTGNFATGSRCTVWLS